MTNRILDNFDIAGTRDLAQLFGLDRLDTRPVQPLICHWTRGDDGQLTCRWAPDVLAQFRPQSARP